MVSKHLKAIGTCSIMWNDNDPRQFTKSLAEFLIYSQRVLCGPDEYIYFTDAKSSYHELNRNELVKECQGEWLLMLDCDHMFTPDLLERLLHLRKKYKTRVLSGIYTFKHPPHNPVAHLWNEDKKGFTSLLTWDVTKEVIECGPCGGGCLLVDRSVYEEVYMKTGQEPFTIISGLSEDYSFFWRCKDLGIPTYLAPKVQCHHLQPRQAISLDYDRIKVAYDQRQL